jgi:hypothetical protein
MVIVSVSSKNLKYTAVDGFNVPSNNSLGETEETRGNRQTE